MEYCTNCGIVVSSEWNFCRRCGEPLRPGFRRQYHEMPRPEYPSHPISRTGRQGHTHGGDNSVQRFLQGLVRELSPLRHQSAVPRNTTEPSRGRSLSRRSIDRPRSMTPVYEVPSTTESIYIDEEGDQGRIAPPEPTEEFEEPEDGDNERTRLFLQQLKEGRKLEMARAVRRRNEATARKLPVPTPPTNPPLPLVQGQPLVSMPRGVPSPPACSWSNDSSKA
jgi:hypothetical protein